MKKINELKELTSNDYNKLVLLKSKIKRKIKKDGAFVEKLMWEYIKFLQLTAEQDDIIPSKQIDVVWHQHMLFSTSYTDFCNYITEDSRLGKRYIHHFPSEGNTKKARKDQNVRYNKTLNWYYTYFQMSPLAEVWLYDTFFGMLSYNFSRTPSYYNLDLETGLDISDVILDVVNVLDEVLDHHSNDDYNTDEFTQEQQVQLEEIYDTIQDIKEDISAPDSYIEEKAEVATDAWSNIDTVVNTESLRSNSSSDTYTSSSLSSSSNDSYSSTDTGSSSSCSSSSCSSSSCSSGD